MAGGFYLMNRGWLDHPALNTGPFDRRSAWVWMIEQAAYATHRKSIAGRTVELKRGQFSASIRFMAKAWRWKRHAVELFLARLKTETMIGTDTGTGQLVITICNYERYQSVAQVEGTAGGTASGTGRGQDGDKIERRERKKTKTLSVGDALPAEIASQFDEFWRIYPPRTGHSNPRAPAEKKFAELVKSGTPAEAIIAGARIYAAEIARNRTEPKFVAQAQTWLNQKRWTDELAAAPPPAKPYPPFRIGG